MDNLSDFMKEIKNYEKNIIPLILYYYQKHKFENKKELDNAIKIWCKNKELGKLMFGEPNLWDVSQVTDMSYLFEESNFNENIDKWQVSQVTNMEGMFYRSKYSQPLKSWSFGNKWMNPAYIWYKADNFDIKTKNKWRNIFQNHPNFANYWTINIWHRTELGDEEKPKYMFMPYRIIHGEERIEYQKYKNKNHLKNLIENLM